METVLELKKKYANAIERIAMAEEVPDTSKEIIPEGILYLSHPFGGLKDNMVEAGQIANRFQKEMGTKGTIISPIHNFSWLAYREESNGYWEDIYHCLVLLSHCDGMILSGDWKKSLGCCIECLYCVEHDIPLYVEAKEKHHG